jgi:Flp pilus assembly pilin Flp
MDKTGFDVSLKMYITTSPAALDRSIDADLQVESPKYGSGSPVAISLALAHLRVENNMKRLRNLWADDEGQDLAEYGLLLILITVAVVAAVTIFRAQIIAVFAAATSALSGA